MRNENKLRVWINTSDNELSNRAKFHDLFTNMPIPSNERLQNLGLYTNRLLMGRMLFMHELYQRILPINGVIMEFGVRWGQNLALFTSFRSMYEPYNYTRKIVGFDTFSGFPSTHEKDGDHETVFKGCYSVTENYEQYLEQVLAYHESEAPISHIKKFELVKGDATKTLEKYLADHPETIIALAYFDFDLYEPTKKCLELIRGHLTKGSVVGFDELNDRAFPGETVAVKEALGLDAYSIRRSPLTPCPSYLVIE
ncbi:hypothetical protein JCM15519_17690 [Fundidesulfovibrio butyratiphilus]